MIAIAESCNTLLLLIAITGFSASVAYCLLRMNGNMLLLIYINGHGLGIRTLSPTTTLYCAEIVPIAQTWTQILIQIPDCKCTNFGTDISVPGLGSESAFGNVNKPLRQRHP